MSDRREEIQLADWEERLWLVAKVIITLAVVSTNICLLISLPIDKRLRNSASSLLIFNMSFVDLLIASFYLTFLIGGDIGQASNWLPNRWRTKLWLTTSSLLLSMSIITSLIVNIERLIVVIKPSLSNRSKTFVNVLMLTLAWIAYAIGTFTYYSNCAEQASLKDWKKLVMNVAVCGCGIKAIVQSLVIFFLPSSVSLILNIIIYCKSRATYRPVRPSAEEEEDQEVPRTAMTFSPLVKCLAHSLFIVLYLPFFVAAICRQRSVPLSSHITYAVQWFAAVNCAVNPFIWLLDDDVRKSYIRVVRTIFCEKKNKPIEGRSESLVVLQDVRSEDSMRDLGDALASMADVAAIL
ncbi:unnamed protein product [Dimorphilus gyrociliatus]|uniref:G-protein coupled receptors family 1 profile domain-containing protein n=1 Tax=Dimorphilus gyrociliatus TaxID=2664684 RepID=A0A7I8V7G5_9ANNE|nr:unnamed protein product [Dimorphilus gyrociliatus]